MSQLLSKDSGTKNPPGWIDKCKTDQSRWRLYETFFLFLFLSYFLFLFFLSLISLSLGWFQNKKVLRTKNYTSLYRGNNLHVICRKVHYEQDDSGLVNGESVCIPLTEFPPSALSVSHTHLALWNLEALRKGLVFQSPGAQRTVPVELDPRVAGPLCWNARKSLVGTADRAEQGFHLGPSGLLCLPGQSRTGTPLTKGNCSL